MFAATVRSSDPDRLVRWVLTLATLATGALLAGLAVVVAWLARLTAELILELLAAWFGWRLLSAPLLDDLVLVDLALEEPELEEDLDDAMGLAEPSEIIGAAPPAWQPPEPDPMPAQRAELVSRQLMLIGALGSDESSGLFSVLSASGASDAALGDSLGDLFADGAIGGLGGRGSGTGSAVGSLRGTGGGADLGSLSGAGDAGGLGSLRGTGGGGGGSGIGTIGRGGIGTLALLQTTHDAAPAGGVTCRATIDPVAPAAQRIRITGCEAVLHDAVTREIRRAGREDRAGRINVQVRPPSEE